MIWLPYPPSANAIWRNVAGRTLKSKPYRDWTVLALASVAKQAPIAVPGPYHMTLLATRPDRRRRDLGNLLKATEDLLTTAGLITDDALASRILLEWSDAEPCREGGVIVTLVAA